MTRTGLGPPSGEPQGTVRPLQTEGGVALEFSSNEVLRASTFISRIHVSLRIEIQENLEKGRKRDRSVYVLVFKVWHVFQYEVSIVSSLRGRCNRPPRRGRGRGEVRHNGQSLAFWGLHVQGRAPQMLRGDGGASSRRVLRGGRGRRCLWPLVQEPRPHRRTSPPQGSHLPKASHASRWELGSTRGFGDMDIRTFNP